MVRVSIHLLLHGPCAAVFINMVELLRSVGYTWSDVASDLLISRTTLWIKLREVGVHLEKYTDISDEALDEKIRALQLNHPPPPPPLNQFRREKSY